MAAGKTQMKMVSQCCPQTPSSFCFFIWKETDEHYHLMVSRHGRNKEWRPRNSNVFLGFLGIRSDTSRLTGGHMARLCEKLWFAGKVKICTNLLQCDHVGRVPLPVLNRVVGNIPQCDKGWKSIIAQTEWIAQLWFPIKSGKDISTGYALQLPSSLPEADRAPYMLNTPFWRTNLKSHSLFSCVVFSNPFVALMRPNEEQQILGGFDA